MVGALVAAFGAGLLAHHFDLRSPIGPSEETSLKARPQPVEYLYLDINRVAAYLAQLDGGIATSERLSETLTSEEKARVSGGEFFEVGASAQHQNFVEREVSPTAAANFFRLLSLLREQKQLHKVSVDALGDFKDVGEGAFVVFSSRDLRTPIYANSYFVVRQSGTLSALFPPFGGTKSHREEIRAQREDARKYAHQVGPNPRIVFGLTPEGDESIKFLLPLLYRQMTDERSLIKDGGGRFTVVGKVVRLFGQRSKSKNKKKKRLRPSYVDSAARETWTKPLEHVPLPLLRRSSRKCKPIANRSRSLESPSLVRAVKKPTLRSCVMSRLEEQTAIPNGGAVILPVAIYK